MTTLLAALVALAVLSRLVWASFFWCCCLEPSPPPTCETTINVTVQGCWGNPIEGATVDLKVATISVDADTTDEDGLSQVVTTQVVGTAAMLEITPPSGCGYQAQTRAVTLNCTTQNVTITLVADASHFCCGSNEFPIPIGPLDFVCDNGSGTLTYDGGGSWSGIVSLTVRMGKTPPWSTYSCVCPPPTGTLTVAKFEYYTVATNFLVTYACGGGGAVTVSFPPGTGDPVWWWWGRTDCTACDWCFGGASHDVPAADAGEIAVFTSGGTEESTCGAYAASGTMPAAGSTKYVSNFDCPLDPTDPGTCGVTPGSILGDWAVST